ncbi:MAG: hypothetical protein CM1200mP30_11080 [Pseudomonadota bacterium]|nr:MAG: hypothetical protein CM1200mP30_11080 [Pseudomonadota bacterium]
MLNSVCTCEQEYTSQTGYGIAPHRRFIDANTALKWGLINRIAPEEKLDEEVQKLADAILSKSSVAVFTGKKMFYEQLEKNMEMPMTLPEKYGVQHDAEDVNEGIEPL